MRKVAGLWNAIRGCAMVVMVDVVRSKEKTTTTDKADAAEADADRCHANGHTQKSGRHEKQHVTSNCNDQ